MKKATVTLAAAVFIFNLHAPARADNDCERQMVRAAAKYEIPLGMLYAVGLTETGRGDSLRPYALNIDGRAVYGTDRQEALREFKKAKDSGAKLVDIGCMQINQKYHGMNFSSVEEMFDPAKNVDYAARFLRELKAREGSWTMAVARYHAGPNNDPAQKRYICRVIANMVASGFGGWTAEARAFCQP